MYGDTTLGGVDFVYRLIDYCIKEFQDKFKEDISEDIYAREKLRVHCERAKKILSNETETTIVANKLIANKDFQITITRQKYEELCDDLVSRCVAPIIIAMKDADMNVQNIDEIVLVGEFTRTPMIARMLSEMFKGK